MSQPSKEVKARYREKHREELRAKGRVYAAKRYANDAEHRERVKQRARDAWIEDREGMRERHRRWYRENPELARAKAAAWKKRNPEKVLAYQRLWEAQNKEKRRTYINKRRALRLKAGGIYTAEEFALLCAVLDQRCFYCDMKKPLHADHVIPLSRGGGNSIDNIVPACKSCNSRKNAKTYSEFVGVSP